MNIHTHIHTFYMHAYTHTTYMYKHPHILQCKHVKTHTLHICMERERERERNFHRYIIHLLP